ncbi:uncharacterized protein LY79DRAFT_674147 [Colletotrichum navitas]|uniref:Uncharacterized protein n=1 Tax=Colletotrichum navitas TaxID=681940 RepID=A0AAD8PM05_9PEZI|nr:uncharacterized protein LY79DRAFT_674147 [Colletotrichum navitas]KAK1570193.1 hypothetical protein LY79DRAFT_674147 [Colletotrichum navitas]
MTDLQPGNRQLIPSCLQYDLYQVEQQFRTLYDLFGVPIDTSQDAISIAYLAKLHEVMPEMQHCWDALAKEQEAMERGTAAQRHSAGAS